MKELSYKERMGAIPMQDNFNAEQSSPEARRVHNPEVVGSNPASAITNVFI